MGRPRVRHVLLPQLEALKRDRTTPDTQWLGPEQTCRAATIALRIWPAISLSPPGECGSMIVLECAPTSLSMSKLLQCANAG